MGVDVKTFGGAEKVQESRAEEFVLGSRSTEPDSSGEKTTNRSLAPYVVLGLGAILLGAGFWILASIAFATYIILTASIFDKNLKQSISLPSELTPTSFHEKPVHDGHF